MSPRLFINDAVDLRNADPEFVGKALLRYATSSISGSDIQNSGSVKLGMRESRTFHVAPLFRHIKRVVSLRAEKQMIGVDAGRIVAAVEDVHSCGDWAKVDFPRKAVSERHDSRRHIGLKPSVSVVVTLARPRPARARFTHLLPKPFFTRGILRHE